MAALCLTADELTAIGHCLGVPRFPGVLDTLYDIVAPELHQVLDGRFLAVLLARGLVHHDGDGGLEPDPELETLLGAFAAARTFIAVEQEQGGARRLHTLMAGELVLVRAEVVDLLHRFGCEPGLADPARRLAAVLAELVDRSAGAGRPPGGRRHGRRSELAALVPPPPGGWRRMTVLARSDDAGDGAQVEGYLAVLDGGPGRLWLVVEDDRYDQPADRAADPVTAQARAVVAMPASSGEVDAAIRMFAARVPLLV